MSAMHPLVAHALDVAAVAILLPQTRSIGLPGQTIGLLVALHDIGKFSRPFQAMAPPHWPAAALGAWREDRRPPPGPKHDSLGFHLLEKVFADRLAAQLPPRTPGQLGWTQGQRGALLRALAGHHGRPPADPGRLGEAVFCAGCHEAAAAFIDAMQALFAPAPLPAPASDHAAARMAWQLAGLTTLADWIGSRQAWFPYVSLLPMEFSNCGHRRRQLRAACASLTALTSLQSTQLLRNYSLRRREHHSCRRRAMCTHPTKLTITHIFGAIRWRY